MLGRLRPADSDLLYLGMLPAGVRAVFAIIALLASLLWLGRVWDLGFDRFAGWRRRRAILIQLDELGTSEIELLAGQTSRNEQTFHARFDDRVAAGLRSKGLALRSDTGHPLGWPHTIPDFLWSELRRRWKDEQKPESRSGSAESVTSRLPRAQRG